MKKSDQMRLLVLIHSYLINLTSKTYHLLSILALSLLFKSLRILSITALSYLVIFYKVRFLYSSVIY